VDTHVKRLSRRLGFSRSLDPDHIEEDLQALLPPENWAKGHQLLVWHGRRTCFARKPACDRCVVAALCPKVGVPKAARGRAPANRVRRAPVARKASARRDVRRSG
jgi:endonuclease-3